MDLSTLHFNANVRQFVSLTSLRTSQFSSHRQPCRWLSALPSEAEAPANERDAWVSSVRNTTGRHKHRVWAPHLSLDPPPLLDDIAVVLVSPKRPSSVGAVARALSCFECVDLRIISPRCDHLARSARNGSKGAQYLLWRARIYETLEEALEGAHSSVAFTRWVNGLHGVPAYRSIAEFLDSPAVGRERLVENPVVKQKHDGKIVLIFGREEEGLRSEEVTACSAACSIPIGRLQESLSLSHAVSLSLAPIFEARQLDIIERDGDGGQFVTSREDLAVGVQSQDD